MVIIISSRSMKNITDVTASKLTSASFDVDDNRMSSLNIENNARMIMKLMKTVDSTTFLTYFAPLKNQGVNTTLMETR